MRIAVESATVRIDGADLLRDVSLSCPSGQVTGLLGPNGSGKTTLLNLIAGLRRPTQGRVLLGERDLEKLSGKTRARTIAVVEQQAVTGLNLTARDVAALGRIPHRGRWFSADPRGADVVEACLEIVAATGYADRQWATLSGGERQRVQLARALAQEPRVLLLDEPTNHLDLAHQLRFLQRVRELSLTTVVALHDLGLAAAYCDQVVVLDSGRLVCQGSVSDVLDPTVVADVYRVDVAVEPHPERSTPHVRWNRPLEDR